MLTAGGEGVGSLVNLLFFNGRHRLLHASQRRDHDGNNQPQCAGGHLTQPAQEGDGARRYVFADGFETLGICCLVHTLRRIGVAQNVLVVEVQGAYTLSLPVQCW